MALAAMVEADVKTRLSQLSVSRSGRFLQDASGKPFFLIGDCPQNLPLKLAVAEMDGYVTDCETKGFNLLWICIDGQRVASPETDDPPPKDRSNNLMMSSGWDIG